MSESQTSRPRRTGKRNDPKALARFLEELSWLLSSYEDLDFKALPAILQPKSGANRRETSAAKRDRESVELLGTLPALFMDDELFPSNEDIAEFSKHALGVAIPRWQKKSKYELIGHIVCNANLLNNSSLQKLFAGVQRLRDERSVERASLKRQRDLGLSWNEVIQIMLSGGVNEGVE